MKLILILMVKNESKIIRRCLESAEPAVDAFCIVDTGSTDNTVDLANEFVKERVGIVAHAEWKNFGHNRTISFEVARNFVKTLKWDSARNTQRPDTHEDRIYHSSVRRQPVLSQLPVDSHGLSVEVRRRHT
jgi:hypothetical protein